MPSHDMGGLHGERALQAQTPLGTPPWGTPWPTYLEMNPGALVLHMVGGFHVEKPHGYAGEAELLPAPGPGTIVVAMELADGHRRLRSPGARPARGTSWSSPTRPWDLYVARELRGEGRGRD